MILLSNHSSSLPKKKIQIKPIELVSESVASTTKEDTYVTLTEKIAEKEKELEELNQRIIANRQSAENDILSLREEWQNEKEQLIQEAQQQGYQQGFEQGKKDSIEQYSHLINEAKLVIEQANDDVQKKIEQSDEVILQIAMHVAEKVLYQSLEEDKTRYIGVVKEAINYVKKYPSIAVYASSKEYSYLLENQDELREILQGQADLSIYPDSELEQYQVYVESPAGRLEVSVDTQLEEIRNHLSQVMEEIIREQREDTGRD